MQMYVGITDYDWFEFLKERKATEVNFWKPGTQPFRALNENDLFLFKLHAPLNYIVGGGFFVKYSFLPSFLAWNAFGEKNGTKSLSELNQAILKYRNKNNIRELSLHIGCIILTDVFYFDEQDWILSPKSFSKNIVQGKRYYTEDEEGSILYQMVQERLGTQDYKSKQEKRFSESLTKHRLGQGAFKVAVTDAYKRRCAITGEKTLPVLEAAHIKPFSEDGPNSVNNGMLLKSDFHTLFDDGYIAIDENYRIDVSKRLHEDYGNGKDYYKYHGKKLLILPDKGIQLPAKEYLEWHNEHVFLG